MTAIDERIEYWRDQVDTLLKSGGAIVILFAGWAIDHHEKFLLDSEDPWGPDASVAAIGLLGASLLYAAFLVGSVCRIYARPLRASSESTVLSRGWATAMSVVLAGAAMLIAALMSFR